MIGSKLPPNEVNQIPSQRVPATSSSTFMMLSFIVKGVAVGGYDPVAYFTAGKPVKGDKAISANHNGAEYRFSSEANRAAFVAAPAKYAPQYGGYCAYAVALGSTAKGNPQNWSIVGGKLYLNLNDSVQSTWNKDKPGFISKANANWPKVLK